MAVFPHGFSQGSPIYPWLGSTGLYLLHYEAAWEDMQGTFVSIFPANSARCDYPLMLAFL